MQRYNIKKRYPIPVEYRLTSWVQLNFHFQELKSGYLTFINILRVNIQKFGSPLRKKYQKKYRKNRSRGITNRKYSKYRSLSLSLSLSRSIPFVDLSLPRLPSLNQIKPRKINSFHRWIRKLHWMRRGRKRGSSIGTRDCRGSLTNYSRARGGGGRGGSRLFSRGPRARHSPLFFPPPFFPQARAPRPPLP